MTQTKEKKDEKNTMEGGKLKKLDLLNDAMFKAIFRSPEARGMISGFLSKITGISKETLLNADYNGGELIKKVKTEKGKTADVIVKINNNRQIIVEMNKSYTPYLFYKNTSYTYSTYLEASRIGKYKNIKVILINIDNFDHFEKNKPIYTFKIQDEDGIIETNTYLSYHFVLENVKNSKYNIDEELRKFAKFFLTKSLEELEENVKGDEEQMAAFRRVEELSTDPEFIGYYDYAEAVEQDKEDMKDYGREIGLKEGIEQGIKQGIEQGIGQGIKQGIEQGIEQGIVQGQKNKEKELIQKMISSGMTIDSISQMLEMSKEKIENLIKEDN